MNLSPRIYMQYLGVLALMGRVVEYHELSLEDRASVDQAFKDANTVLKALRSDTVFARSSNGWAAFDRSQIIKKPRRKAS